MGRGGFRGGDCATGTISLAERAKRVKRKSFVMFECGRGI